MYGLKPVPFKLTHCPQKIFGQMQQEGEVCSGSYNE